VKKRKGLRAKHHEVFVVAIVGGEGQTADRKAKFWYGFVYAMCDMLCDATVVKPSASEG
jgi:hypothetical protein